MTRPAFMQGRAVIPAAMGAPLSLAAEAQEQREEAGREQRPVKSAFVGLARKGSGRN
jgi:hypothetical protein